MLHTFDQQHANSYLDKKPTGDAAIPLKTRALLSWLYSCICEWDQGVFSICNLGVSQNGWNSVCVKCLCNTIDNNAQYLRCARFSHEMFKWKIRTEPFIYVRSATFCSGRCRACPNNIQWSRNSVQGKLINKLPLNLYFWTLQLIYTKCLKLTVLSTTTEMLFTLKSCSYFLWRQKVFNASLFSPPNI